MTTTPIFIYSWHVEDDDIEDENRFVIRGFGVTSLKTNVMIEITDFPLYLYIELPSHIQWRQSRMLLNHVQEKLMECFQRFSINPVKMALLYKRKLYYYSEEQFPFLFVAFSTQGDRTSASRILMKQDVLTVFGKRIRIRCHEHEASGLLQFLCFKNIESTGWVDATNGTLVQDNRTWCDQVVRCSYKDIEQFESDIVPEFNIYSFDLEVYSSDHSKMPNAQLKKDEIFQISIVGANKKLLLTLGDNIHIHKEDTITVCYKSEKELLLGFSHWIIKLGVHVLIGYNIFGFDIPYMMDRAKIHGVYSQFCIQGMLKNRVCKEKQISWSSSAYKNQEFRYIDIIGRVVVDLLPQIQRDYKLSNYKLSTVAQHFLDADKDPVKPKDIFEFYHRYLQKNDEFASELLATIGEYCIQDSQLVLDLFQKLELWIGLIEMAKTCNVAVPCLYTQGQQIKVYSQIYKQCLYQKIVVESSQYHKNTNSNQYTGAFVFDPQPGIYNDIIPFDFAALYPTTIIAYNIDFSTLVTDRNVPDDECHVIEWTEDSKTYRYRFIKSMKGVIPRMLEDLLKKRKDTKSEMKHYGKDSMMRTVLDKRQLALKVSANSAYGIMGATKGYLPFLPGAMSTTAMGRHSILKAAEHVKKTYGGQLIYGDSVCGHTPVTIRINRKHVHILEIQDLTHLISRGYWRPLGGGKEFIEFENVFVESWSEEGWTRMYRIIRHDLGGEKNIFRVRTSNGDVVDVTDDHSLLDWMGRIVKPSQLLSNPGVVLLSSPFPESTDPERGTTVRTEVEAFMYGQCGSCHIPDWILHTKDTSFLRAYWNGFCRSHNYVLNGQTGTVEICLRTQLLCQKAYALIHKLGFSVNKIEQGYHCYSIEVNVNSRSRSPLRSEIVDVKKIPYSGHVYDLTTANHHFAAGIGNLVVHNTDSIYCHFPTVSGNDLWKFALKIEREFMQLFPPPMKLAFEEKIYKRFLILTKKRYMAFTQNADLSIDKGLTIRGVLLARRDNCKWIRNVYEVMVRTLMDLGKTSIQTTEIEQLIQEEIIKLCSHYYDSSFVTITKTVGSEYKKKVVTGYDEATGKITDIAKFKKRLNELDICLKDPKWMEIYHSRMNPAHVQLADKMAVRGCPVSAGTRIEYLMVQHENPKAKQFQKIEDPDYQKEYSDVLKLDYLFVLQLAKNSLHQLISVVFKDSTMIDTLIGLHTQKTEIMKELRSMYHPKIIFA